MSRMIKYGLGIIVGLLILLGLTLITLTFLINPNDYKTPINNKISQITGQRFEIRGDVSWSLFPWLGLKVDDVVLENPPGFSTTTLAHINHFSAYIKLLPLLERKIEISSVNLGSLELTLIKNVDGSSNWQNLMNLGHKAGDNSQATKQSNSKQMALMISAIHLSDATIHYQDLQSHQDYRLDHLDLSSKNIGLDRTFSLQLTTDFSSQAQKASGNISLDANINFKSQTQVLTLSPITIEGNLKTAQMTKSVPIDLSTNALIDLKAQTFQLDKLKGSVANLRLQSELSGSNFKAPQFTGKITVPPFNPQTLLAALGGKPATFNDPHAFSSLQVAGNLSGNMQTIAIRNLFAKLDDSQLKGSVSVGLAPTSPTQFDVDIDRINFYNYASPAASSAKTSSQQTKTQATSAGSASDKDISASLNKLNLDGKLRIHSLLYKTTQVSNANITLKAHNGLINENTVITDVYQGSYTSNTAINTQGATPNFTTHIRFNNVQIEPLYKSFWPTQKISFSGTANISADLNARGLQAATLTRTLSGQVNADIKQGKINGLDLLSQVKNALALINKQKASNGQQGQTQFVELSATVNITDGLTDNRNLLLTSEDLTAKGHGTLNLITQGIDYKLDVIASDHSFIPGVNTVQKNIGGSFPILITGSLADYHVYPDIEAITKALATNAAKKLLDPNGAVGQEVDKKLKGLGNTIQKGIQILLPGQ